MLLSLSLYITAMAAVVMALLSTAAATAPLEARNTRKFESRVVTGLFWMIRPAQSRVLAFRLL